MIRKRTLLVLVLFVSFTVISIGQVQTDAVSNVVDLNNRHCLSLNFGLINQTSVVVNAPNVNVKINFLGSILYNYWATNEIAIDFNIGLLSAEVKQGITFAGIEQSTAAVIPFQFGFRYYPASMVIGNNIRPFTAINLVAANGYSVSNKVLIGIKVGTETKNQTALGARIGFGADAFINNWLKLGINTGYLLISDFSEVVGTRKNYSGLDLSFSFGVLL